MFLEVVGGGFTRFLSQIITPTTTTTATTAKSSQELFAIVAIVAIKFTSP